MDDWIELDGSYGEGGGAILRQALGMAVYAGRPVRIYNIRGGRRKPGLAPQHLKAVRALGALCGAEIEGADLGSTAISFRPGRPKSGSYQFDIGTAGSTTLLLQALLLPCLSSGDRYEFRLTGGTDVPWSPPADYLGQVTLRALGALGDAELQVRRRGYYPKGAGRLLARLRGSDSAVAFEFLAPGEVKGIRGVSHAARALNERRVAERQADAADHLLKRLGYPVEIAVEYSNAACPGSGVTLWTEAERGAPLGGSALGARGKAADEVGREAARELMAAMDSGAAVDRHLADQLIPFLAVYGGSLRAPELTPHVRSSLYVAETVLGARFEVAEATITTPGIR